MSAHLQTPMIIMHLRRDKSTSLRKTESRLYNNDINSSGYKKIYGDTSERSASESYSKQKRCEQRNFDFFNFECVFQIGLSFFR